MPHRAMKPCNHPGCGVAINAKDKYCVAHVAAHKKDYPRRNPESNRIYGTQRWRKYRRWFLNRNPVCIECGELAAVVDHILPVNQGGDFWAIENQQPLCKRCHDIKTGKESAFGKNTPRP